MSTKGDLMTNTSTPSNSKSLQPDSSTQKNSPAFFKKNTTHTSNNSAQSLSNRDSFFSVKTPLNTEGNHPKSTSIACSSLSFTSRFDAKTPLRALTIDTASEASSFNLDSNHIGSYSATHNPANQHVHTGNSLISSLNGNLSAKHSRAFESYKRPVLTSPSKSPAMSKSLIAANFPFSTSSLTPSKVASVLGSNFANSILNNSSLLNSLSPTSLQAKKITNKSYSQDRYKPSSLYNYFDRKGTSSGLLRKSSNVLENSNTSDNSRSFNTSSNIENNSHSTEKSMDSSLYGLFGLQKSNNHSHSVQASTGTKFTMPMPNHEPTKCSVKRNGVVKAYAANTNQGIVRNYNEDRVSIILNIMKPASRVNEEWPKCSFFGVYDGHGGVACADFLRDNLHQYVIKEPSFPWNPKEALIKGFEAAEKAFLELAEAMPNGGHNRSGSCALTALIVGDMCYVANVGDSRAVMSGEGGTKIYPLSKDHKPNEDNEQKRILEAGGKIYQSQAPVVKQMGNGSSTSSQMLLSGPHRVFPGRLSVSRTFGDIEAKLPKYGGNPNVVVATPDIKTFRISPQHDYIILATDGIWDKLSSRDAIKSVWESTKEKATNFHHQCGIAVENILSESINRRTLDNITVVMICFKNFQQKLFPQENSKTGDALDVTQKDSDSSSTTHQTSAVMESLKGSVLETEPDVHNTVIKKEELNLQEKVNNAEEKAVVVEKRPTIKPKPSTERATNSVSQVDLNIKKLVAPLRESLTQQQQQPEVKNKKENTKSLPISDVNLLSKRLIAKKLNDPQKLTSSSKLVSQESMSVQKLIELKKKEAANKANILKN